ncbi:MAG: murein biosynthesis integral membrane protein MurJ [Phycisphaerae bacterium]|nr:murein biosynthesis integral membrane protein MurJ [Phycisphaerae bacterium]
MSGLGGSSRVVSALTLGSRCTGLLRDAVFARSFGVGGVADIFFLAFQIPNLFRRLFGEGALSAAFLPMYAERFRQDRGSAARFAAAGISAGIALLTILIAVLELVLCAQQPEGENLKLAASLLQIVLPYAPLVCLVALLGAVLQVRGRFAPTAAAPAILNLALVISILSAPTEDIEAKMHRAAWSVLIAGLLQVAWSVSVLGSQPFAKPDSKAWHEAKVLAKRAVPVGMGLSVLQVNILTDTLLASWPALFGATIFGIAYPLEEGANAAISLASRLYQFPLGVFGIAVATAAFPRLSQTKENPEAFQDTLRTALGMALFVGLPASIGLCVVATPMVRTVFEGGVFEATDAPRVARLLWTYGPGIWAMSCVHVLVRACYAKGDRRGPVRIGMLVVGTNLLLNIILIWTPLEEAALGLTTSVGSAVQCAWLCRRLGAKFAGARGIVIASGIMLPLILGASWALQGASPWIRALGIVGTGAVTFAISARHFAPEVWSSWVKRS